MTTWFTKSNSTHWKPIALAEFEKHFEDAEAYDFPLDGLCGVVVASRGEPVELNPWLCGAVAWVFGSDGLTYVLSHPMSAALEGRTFDVCIGLMLDHAALGLDASFIYSRLKAGEDFYLIVCQGILLYILVLLDIVSVPLPPNSYSEPHIYMTITSDAVYVIYTCCAKV